jgi:biotin transport system substrate-specific component
MTTTTTAAHPPQPVLADLVAGTRLRDASLVLACTGFMIIAAQLAIPLWFTPVPLSLATFAVMLSGAALGPARAGLGVGLYLALGVAGFPVFADRGSGWAFASFGYIIGYVLAAVVVGAFARRRADRSPWRTATAAVVGSLIVYATGLPWLMHHLDVGLTRGLELGVWPFLVGDAIKTAAVAVLLPVTWKLVDSAR